MLFLVGFTDSGVCVIGGSSSGRTLRSGRRNRGSNPCPPAKVFFL